MPTNNDSTLVLEGFLAALLRHHGETSCIDTACVDSNFIPFKVNVIFDNCAIHPTKRTTISKRTSKYDSRTMSFKVPSPVVEDRPAVPPYRNGERDTSKGAYYHHKMSRPHSEEQHGDIPKESLHQSSTRAMTSTTYRSCADAATVAAAVHCKSRWSSSPPIIMPVMREPRNGHHQRIFSADHDLHGRFPTPPHPARRQVSIESDNSTELAANASSHRDAIDLGEEQGESIQHVPGPNKDCNNVIALVDHALHAIAPISFPDAGQSERRTPCPAVMPCHSLAFSCVDKLMSRTHD